MTSKRREYHVDCHAKKAAIFFMACEPNPATTVKIPEAMKIEGLSEAETANRTLQQQVSYEADKIKGGDVPSR